MERYTEKHYDGNGYYLICSGNCETFNCGDCGILDKIVDRLAAYEDTGLEPEDFKRTFTEDALLKLTGQLLNVHQVSSFCISARISALRCIHHATAGHRGKL